MRLWRILHTLAVRDVLCRRPPRYSWGLEAVGAGAGSGACCSVSDSAPHPVPGQPGKSRPRLVSGLYLLLGSKPGRQNNIHAPKPQASLQHSIPSAHPSRPNRLIMSPGCCVWHGIMDLDATLHGTLLRVGWVGTQVLGSLPSRHRPPSASNEFDWSRCPHRMPRRPTCPPPHLSTSPTPPQKGATGCLARQQRALDPGPRTQDPDPLPCPASFRVCRAHLANPTSPPHPLRMNLKL